MQYLQIFLNNYDLKSEKSLQILPKNKTSIFLKV